VCAYHVRNLEGEEEVVSFSRDPRIAPCRIRRRRTYGDQRRVIERGLEPETPGPDEKEERDRFVLDSCVARGPGAAGVAPAKDPKEQRRPLVPGPIRVPVARDCGSERPRRPGCSSSSISQVSPSAPRLLVRLERRALGPVATTLASARMGSSRGGHCTGSRSSCPAGARSATLATASQGKALSGGAFRAGGDSWST
jgi:hypothetical protein